MQNAPFELEFPTDRILEGFAREIIKHTRVDQYLSDRQRDFSDHRAFGQLLNERLRLASELHDGLLQALTGAALQLNATLQILESNPHAASARIRETQELIIERQRELRAFIERVRHPEASHASIHIDLVVVLRKLCDRVSRWGPKVELHTHDCSDIPDPLADHVHRLVEEGLSNVTRHARARVAHVDAGISDHAVRIAIADDGSGFPFRGRYDLAELEARGIGPAALKERVASLGGSLMLTSTLSGSMIAIGLPLSGAFSYNDFGREMQA